MITAKRRTVYLVRGRTMLTRAGAYRREAWFQLREESEECKGCQGPCYDYGMPPNDAHKVLCEYYPRNAAVDARAGILFERDFGVKP